MKLWKISQSENNNYSTYDSAVVAAETEDEARRTISFNPSYWASSPEHVHVELIGEAISGTKAGVIVASYNAG